MKKTTTNGVASTYYLCQYLLLCGVDLGQVVWQSDNGIVSLPNYGAEFI
jgi:hypothetical protein